jgi:hypothetical protein
VRGKREPSNKQSAREPVSNLIPVCTNCRKPDPKFARMPCDYFIGKYVKLGFKVTDEVKKIAKEHGVSCPEVEHMWVVVTKLAITPGQELQGKVNNDPVFAIEWPCDTEIEFNRQEIEQVMEG